MVYFCADDYGISKESNNRIESCLESGVLNKVSVLPNGETDDFKNRLLEKNAKLSLHINLVEGFPLSDANLIVSDKGNFKYSFIGLFFLSLFGKRKQLKKELYKEIKMQIDFFRTNVGEETPLFLDSHQHTHMIPLVFKTLVKVIKDEGINIENIRFPSEPILPYILTPSLYFKYGVTGIIKQWLLKFLGFINNKELKKLNIKPNIFMGVIFSGCVTEEKIKKILPKYLKIANKNGKDIEIALHPGYVEKGEHLIKGCRAGFEKFYFSQWRKVEYETLLNLNKAKKEGN